MHGWRQIWTTLPKTIWANNTLSYKICVCHSEKRIRNSRLHLRLRMLTLHCKISELLLYKWISSAIACVLFQLHIIEPILIFFRGKLENFDLFSITSYFWLFSWPIFHRIVSIYLFFWSQWPGISSHTAASAPAATPAADVLVSTSAAPVPVINQTVTPQKCNWTEHTSPDGYKYYYNNTTGESKVRSNSWLSYSFFLFLGS